MTLKIEAGKFYRTRDGRKVGPMVLGRDALHTSYMWAEDETHEGAWCETGGYGLTRLLDGDDSDLIAEWTDEPEAAPIDNASPLRRHAEVERPTPDLTAITTPFGLLPPETQQALRDHGGPYQIYRYDGWRVASPRTDLWTKEAVFRVNPNATPCEGYAVTLFRTAREAKTAHPGCDPIFVREVKE